MTVHMPSAPTVTTSGQGPRTGQHRSLVIGVVVTFAVLGAVLVAGRVATTRTTSAPTTTPAPSGELNAKALADRYSTAGMSKPIRDDTGAWLHQQSASTPTGVQSGYSDPATVARHFTTPSHELNAKAIADRYSTTVSSKPIRDDTGAWLHRHAISTPTGVQSGYSDPATVVRHFTSPNYELNAKALADRYSTAPRPELNAKALADRYSTTATSPAPPGVQLRRSTRIVDPEPSVQIPPQLVP